jgi:hypothetical protein
VNHVWQQALYSRASRAISENSKSPTCQLIVHVLHWTENVTVYHGFEPAAMQFVHLVHPCKLVVWSSGCPGAYSRPPLISYGCFKYYYPWFKRSTSKETPIAHKESKPNPVLKHGPSRYWQVKGDFHKFPTKFHKEFNTSCVCTILRWYSCHTRLWPHGTQALVGQQNYVVYLYELLVQLPCYIEIFETKSTCRRNCISEVMWDHACVINIAEHASMRFLHQCS